MSAGDKFRVAGRRKRWKGRSEDVQRASKRSSRAVLCFRVQNIATEGPVRKRPLLRAITSNGVPIRQNGLFTDDWHHDYFLVHLRAKLETMERYNNQLSYASHGPYYGHQIGKAIKMIDIILQEGGRSNYDERDDYMPIPESFKHYVNMRNRSRIQRPDDGGLHFWSDAQCLRFDKAWMLLWKILSERLMTWGD